MRYAPRRSQPEEGAGRRDKLLDVNHRLFALQMVRPGLMYSLFYCVLLVVAVLFCFCERDWLQVSISERNPRRVLCFPSLDGAEIRDRFSHDHTGYQIRD